jgi:hypothetical protein
MDNRRPHTEDEDYTVTNHTCHLKYTPKVHELANNFGITEELPDDDLGIETCRSF